MASSALTNACTPVTQSLFESAAILAISGFKPFNSACDAKGSMMSASPVSDIAGQSAPKHEEAGLSKPKQFKSSFESASLRYFSSLGLAISSHISEFSIITPISPAFVSAISDESSAIMPMLNRYANVPMVAWPQRGTSSTGVK